MRGALLLLALLLAGCATPLPSGETASRAPFACRVPCIVAVDDGPGSARDPTVAAAPGDARFLAALHHPYREGASAGLRETHLAISDDGGASWRARTIDVGLADATDPALLVLGDRTILAAMSGISTLSGELPSGFEILVARIEGEGESVEVTRLAPTSPRIRDAVVLFTDGPTIVAGWVERNPLAGAWIATSEDEGRTWSVPRLVSAAHAPWRAIARADGAWALLLERPEAPLRSFLDLALSDDRGATWRIAPIDARHAPGLYGLAEVDGRLAVATAAENGTARDLLLFESTDGVSWSERRLTGPNDIEPRPALASSGDALFLTYAWAESDAVQMRALRVTADGVSDPLVLDADTGRAQGDDTAVYGDYMGIAPTAPGEAFAVWTRGAPGAVDVAGAALR